MISTPKAAGFPVSATLLKNGSERRADSLDGAAIRAQVHRDLFGTKDVQNVATASYVWLADQLGHVTLGFLPTALSFWILQWIAVRWKWSAPNLWLLECVVPCAILYWFYRKERNDFRETKSSAGHTFPFDAQDIAWNVKTVLVYVGLGAASAALAFTSPWSLAAFVIMAPWPAMTIAHWWLKRKLAFQGSGVPFLFRLANFDRSFAGEAKPQVGAVTAVANLGNAKIRLSQVLTGRGPPRHVRTLAHRHLIVSGPFNSGKTRLAVGIATEFAFALGLGRFVSPIELLEAIAAPLDPNQPLTGGDGRLLWPLKDCELVVVDNLDAAVSGTVPRLIAPGRFIEALKAASGKAGPPLEWLAERRSVWVIGGVGSATEWRAALSGALGLAEEHVGFIELAAPVKPVVSSKPL